MRLPTSGLAWTAFCTASGTWTPGGIERPFASTTRMVNVPPAAFLALLAAVDDADDGVGAVEDAAVAEWMEGVVEEATGLVGVVGDFGVAWWPWRWWPVVASLISALPFGSADRHPARERMETDSCQSSNPSSSCDSSSSSLRLRARFQLPDEAEVA